MIEVHHLNNSRSQRVLWALEELSLPYTIIPYQRDATTMLAPPSLKAVHPLGKSPVIRDGDRTMAESAAILEYLVEHYGAGKLAPARGSLNYERYRYWLHYAEGSLMSQMLVKLYLGRVGEPGRAQLERIEAQIRAHLDFVEGELGDAEYLAGAEFTAADIQMSFPLEVAAPQKLLNDQHPRLRKLLARLHARPAYQRALEKGGPYAYAKD
ncbi:MAG TPA: glutathione S-transferase family protein [Steroidobacteraceae bacterium]|nr:glutathione S-transferase family protein [Steroidobacteraceae bacterium]